MDNVILSLSELLRTSPVVIATISAIGFFTIQRIIKYLEKSNVKDDFYLSIEADKNREMAAMLDHRLELLETKRNTVDLSDEERKIIKVETIEKIRSQEVSTLLAEIKNDLIRQEDTTQIRRLYDLSIKRLVSEVQAQEKRANVNLIIGITLAVSGIIILGLFTIQQSSIDLASKDAFITIFAPRFLVRITLVILIEIFSYFFLKLYRSGTSEIKYFQNELTNVEFRVFALELILSKEKIKITEEILTSFLKTERNFILKKGEKTIEIATEETAARSDRHFEDLFDKITSKLSRHTIGGKSE